MWPFTLIERVLNEMLRAQLKLLEQGKIMIHEMDDLKAAQAALAAAVTDAIAAIRSETQRILDALQQPAIDPADVEAAAAGIGGLATALEGIVTAANAALAPPASDTAAGADTAG